MQRGSLGELFACRPENLCRLGGGNGRARDICRPHRSRQQRCNDEKACEGKVPSTMSHGDAPWLVSSYIARSAGSLASCTPDPVDNPNIVTLAGMTKVALVIPSETGEALAHLTICE